MSRMQWLWRPELNPQRPVSEENYRCFCSYMPAKLGCALFVLLDLFIIFIWSGIFCFLPEYYYFWIAGILNSVFFIVFALYALYKQTPILVQIYWILFLTELVLFSILFAVLNLFVMGTAISFIIFFWQDKSLLLDAILTIIASNLIMILVIFIGTWRATVTWGYYKFARDKLLANEFEHPTGWWRIP